MENLTLVGKKDREKQRVIYFAFLCEQKVEKIVKRQLLLSAINILYQMRRRKEENDPDFPQEANILMRGDYADGLGVHSWNSYNFEHKSASNVPRNGTQNKHFQKGNHGLEFEWK